MAERSRQHYHSMALYMKTTHATSFYWGVARTSTRYCYAENLNHLNWKVDDGGGNQFADMSLCLAKGD